MSTKRGRRSSYSSTLLDATKLNGVVRTSAPGARSRADTMQCRAAVPLLTATAWAVSHRSAILASKASRAGPRERRPERSTSNTRSRS